VEKGYAFTLQPVFDEYLDEFAKGYGYRREAALAEGVTMIREAGGIASRAPVRVNGDITP